MLIELATMSHFGIVFMVDLTLFPRKQIQNLDFKCPENPTFNFMLEK